MVTGAPGSLMYFPSSYIGVDVNNTETSMIYCFIETIALKYCLTKLIIDPGLFI